MRVAERVSVVLDPSNPLRFEASDDEADDDEADDDEADDDEAGGGGDGDGDGDGDAFRNSQLFDLCDSLSLS